MGGVAIFEDRRPTGISGSRLRQIRSNISPRASGESFLSWCQVLTFQLDVTSDMEHGQRSIIQMSLYVPYNETWRRLCVFNVMAEPGEYHIVHLRAIH